MNKRPLKKNKKPFQVNKSTLQVASPTTTFFPSKYKLF